MPTDREAMKMAIEALEIINDAYNLRMYHQGLVNAALTALRQAADPDTQQGADGVPPSAPDHRKPWEKSSWTCARARVDHEGVHCPATGRCPDCIGKPINTDGVKGPTE